MADNEVAGSSKGGFARAEILPPERRIEIGRKAAEARWSKPAPVLAKYGAMDRPLRIGSISIPCYVLADGTRVLAQRGLQSGIGLSEGGVGGGARKIAVLMDRLQKKGIDTKDLAVRANSPIWFIPPHGGNPAGGYDATILPDICAVLIEAGRVGALDRRIAHIAERAAVLQHGFATVGIISLVDEATGYQEIRARDALAKILERFVAKEIRPWISTFPADYYRQIYRLNGWTFDEDSNARPGIVGHWTNNIVYKRLAPGVWEELNRVTPRLDSGKLKRKLFQRLTDNIGYPKLREHLAALVMLMKYSPNWQVFMDRVDREFPQWGETMMLPFPDEYDPPLPDTLDQ